MRLTIKEIKQIIKEELNKLLKENQEGGFDPNEEIPDAAPEGSEKTYDSAFASTQKESGGCYELLEKVIELCTVLRFVRDGKRWRALAVNVNHPLIRFTGDRHQEVDGKDTLWLIHRDLKEILNKKLIVSVNYSRGPDGHKRSIVGKCFWWKIVLKVHDQVYGKFWHLFLTTGVHNDERKIMFLQFMALLAKELRKVQKGEVSASEEGGEFERALKESNDLRQKIENLLNSSEIKDIKQGLLFNKALKVIPEDEIANMLVSKISNEGRPSENAKKYWGDDGLAWFLLEKFPNSMRNNIKFLGLDKTVTTKLPESIGKLINLKVLGMDETSIASLPESIGNLKNLELLDLSGSSISELPESFGNLSNLKFLGLSGSKISKLPQSLKNLKNLEKLYLRSTKLTILDVPENLRKVTRI